jgi:hypothetical protein
MVFITTDYLSCHWCFAVGIFVADFEKILFASEVYFSAAEFLIDQAENFCQELATLNHTALEFYKSDHNG